MSIRARVISALVALPLAAVALTACGPAEDAEPATTIVQTDAPAAQRKLVAEPVPSETPTVALVYAAGSPTVIDDFGTTLTVSEVAPGDFVAELLSDGREVVLEGKFVGVDSSGVEHVAVTTMPYMMTRGYAGDRLDFGGASIVSISYTGNGVSVEWVAN